jgi:MFS family permease
MNTLGNLGGLIGPLVVGIAVDRWGSWTFPFYVTAIVYASGAAAWLAIDPSKPIGRLGANGFEPKRGAIVEEDLL